MPTPTSVGTVEHGADQPVVALPLEEVLIDERLRPEAQALGDTVAPAVSDLEVGVAGEHRFGQHRGAGARAADDRPGPMAPLG